MNFMRNDQKNTWALFVVCGEDPRIVISSKAKQTLDSFRSVVRFPKRKHDKSLHDLNCE